MCHGVQGVFEVCKERGLLLVEIGEGVSVDDVRAATGGSFQVGTQYHLTDLVSLCVCVCVVCCVLCVV